MDETSPLTILEVLLFGMLGMFVMAIVIIVFFLVYQRRLLAQQKSNQQMAIAHQESLLQASISSQEKERNRLAKDLHDDIGAMLTTIKLYTDQISGDCDLEELEKLRLKTNQLVDQTLLSVRRISYDLYPVVLQNLSLEEALETLCSEINDSNSIKINLSYDGLPNLIFEHQLAIYRIVQELISNTLKHASAKTIHIKFHSFGDKLQLEYMDDGDGYVPADASKSKGLGMKSIQSRVGLLGGHLQYVKDKERTKVILTIHKDDKTSIG